MDPSYNFVKLNLDEETRLNIIATLFATERNNEKPPDYVLTKAQETNNLLATLTPSSSSLPERTFARILTLVSKKAPNYSWYSNNCYWYAGSVYETLRVGLKGYTEARTDEWKRLNICSGGQRAPHLETVSIISTNLGMHPHSERRVRWHTAWATPPAGMDGELPHDRVIRGFGQRENLEAYRLLHEKNIGPLQVAGLRVGFILHDLAGPLGPGQKFEDLPVLQDWIRQASLSVIPPG
ncbi:hypothetical protein C8J57DRAFT_1230473 [Mycena rebaudengoi]|nr:hypothetical protein C8J57DRAFT_1230473 [Mycena rebaudengoi]